MSTFKTEGGIEGGGAGWQGGREAGRQAGRQGGGAAGRQSGRAAERQGGTIIDHSPFGTLQYSILKPRSVSAESEPNVTRTVFLVPVITSVGNLVPHQRWMLRDHTLSPAEYTVTFNIVVNKAQNTILEDKLVFSCVRACVRAECVRVCMRRACVCTCLGACVRKHARHRL